MCVFVTRCFRGYDDQDHEEGDQGRVECGVRDRGEDLAIAVEKEGKGIGDLVADEDVPWLDNANVVSQTRSERQEDLQIGMRQLPTADSRRPNG